MGAGAELGLGLTSAMGLEGGATATATGIGTVTGATVVEGISTATATGLGTVSISAGSALAEGIATLTVAQSTVATTTAAVIQGMTQGAFTALCSHSAVSLLQNRGNVGHVLNELTSKDALKGIFSSALVSGMTAGLGEKLGIQTKAPELAKLTKMDFMQGCLGHLKSQLLKEGVSLSVHTAFDGGKFKDALGQSVRHVVSNVIGGVSSNVVGGLYHDEHIDTITHKLSHAIIGATEGAILGDIKAGALGAVIAESLAETIKPLFDTLEGAADTAKVITAGILGTFGFDVETAIATATVAVENNFLTGEDILVGLEEQKEEETVEDVRERVKETVEEVVDMAKSDLQDAREYVQEDPDGFVEIGMMLATRGSGKVGGAKGVKGTKKIVVEDAPVKGGSSMLERVLEPRQQSHLPVKAPKELPAFPDAIRVEPKSFVQGGGTMRRRWETKKNIFEWDSRHGTVEVYNKQGTQHLGEFDPHTGKQLKPADPTRKTVK
jgi:hypothetical protein